MKKIILIVVMSAIIGWQAFTQDFDKTKKKLENPVAGMYQPSYATLGYPYTTIYKPFQDNSMDTFIEDLRNKIANKKVTKITHYYDLYDGIYSNAQQAIDLDNELGGERVYGAGANAYLAKHTAFVYLMGFNQFGRMLRGTGNPHDKDTLETLRIKALTRLINLNYGVKKKNYVQWRFKELIQYLQAYDLLKAAGVISDSLEDAKYSLI